jgi:hypothetical protein
MNIKRQRKSSRKWGSALFVGFDMANLATIRALALCTGSLRSSDGRRWRARIISRTIEVDSLLLVPSNATFFVAL